MNVFHAKHCLAPLEIEEEEPLTLGEEVQAAVETLSQQVVSFPDVTVWLNYANSLKLSMPELASFFGSDSLIEQFSFTECVFNQTC